MSHPDSLALLAAQQADLVRALAGQGPVPPEWDAARVEAAAASLVQKRVRTVARAWPGLARALADFAARFTAFARGTPPPRAGGPLADGYAFARTLARTERLPAAAWRELLAVEARYVASADGLSPRRGGYFRLACRTAPLQLVIIIKLPGLRPRWLGVGGGTER